MVRRFFAAFIAAAAGSATDVISENRLLRDDPLLLKVFFLLGWRTGLARWSAQLLTTEGSRVHGRLLRALFR